MLEIEDFVNRNIEEIKQDSANTAVSWYSLLANIANIKRGMISSKLKGCLEALQSIIPAKQRDSILMNMVDKVNAFDNLKKCLNQLRTTRHIEDYNKDCLWAEVIAKQLLPEGYQEASVVKMLLAMSVLNDYSFVRQMETDVTNVGPVQFFQEKITRLMGLYENEKK